MNEQNEGDKSMVTETLFRKERKKSGGAPKCGCLGLPCVCSTCQHKPRLNVNKAGTPGFRAPEVLLKSSDQTPLIDIWAAGVTFLSLLCHQHPVMRPADDEEAIAQIAVLFGTAPLQHYADKIGVSLLAEPVFPGLDIVKFVRAVREGVITKGDQLRCTSCKILFYGNSQGICLCKSTEETSLSQLSPEERQVFEVLLRCLTVDPSERYSAEMLKNYFY
ncbi:hypothetical protein AB6A40_008350 [Gnathostoma spinigerum]|uniref:non-specific serine/threonine protein kinase n=1 Tax=Gnathostoma spinigerum TaxID=75299 RepID=A0ABD6EVY2_9BILA